jgi:hypothetical protein
MTSGVRKPNVAAALYLPPQPGRQATQGKISGGPRCRCPSNLIRPRKCIAKKNSKIFCAVLPSLRESGLASSGSQEWSRASLPTDAESSVGTNGQLFGECLLRGDWWMVEVCLRSRSNSSRLTKVVQRVIRRTALVSSRCFLQNFPNDSEPNSFRGTVCPVCAYQAQIPLHVREADPGKSQTAISPLGRLHWGGFPLAECKKH